MRRPRILAVLGGDLRIRSAPCHTIDAVRRVNRAAAEVYF